MSRDPAYGYQTFFGRSLISTAPIVVAERARRVDIYREQVAERGRIRWLAKPHDPEIDGERR